MMQHRQGNGRPAPAGGGRRITWRRGAAIAFGAVLAVVLPISGCDSGPKQTRAPGVAPAPTYTGPAYLRGTIGSLAGLRQGTDRPLLVNGYGVVINLNGTGSTSAPPAIRQALINEMRKSGLGSATRGTMNMTPERVLADPNTTVVRIDGLIPPGATPGLRFDVLVTALDSQTTSLAGGLLWTSTLGQFGAEQPFRYLHEQASAYGPIYDNPFREGQDKQSSQFSGRQAIVVAGGKVTASRDLELVLNQASYTRSRAIADRINERFGVETDPEKIAKPMTDQLIKISVPARYQAEPGELIELIMHLYLQAEPGFEVDQARRLAEVLRERPEAERSVRLAWQALGRPIVEVLREYYNDPQLSMRLAALEAGAWLKDERASQSLSELAGHDDPLIRARVAEALVQLPRSLTGSRTLKELLDDEQTSVRIAAYESLAQIGDRLITDGRVLVADDLGTGVKYIIDTVPGDRPLVYITQVGAPRIVIFNPELGFKTPMLARLWDNRLMLSMDPGQGYMDLFYQPPAWANPEGRSSVKLKAVPDLKTLVYLLGHKPSVDEPTEGLGLTYSQVVDAVYYLCRQGHVESPIEAVGSSLAAQIQALDQGATPDARPETGTDPADPDGFSSDDSGPAPLPAGRPDTTPTATDPSRASSR